MKLSFQGYFSKIHKWVGRGFQIDHSFGINSYANIELMFVWMINNSEYQIKSYTLFQTTLLSTITLLLY